METTYVLLRAVHIVCGMTALFVAPGAMLTVKGSLWHRRWGKVYFWAMAAVAVTAILLSLIKPNLFLLMVALFSFYLAFSGYRALYLKRPSDRPSALDWIGLALMALGSVGLLGWALLMFDSGITTSRVALVFGVLGSVASLTSLRRLIKPAQDKQAWLYRHMIGMLSAYIATVSAFSVVNFMFLPPLARWLWAGVVGGILIGVWVTHYKRKFSRRAVLEPSV